MKEEEIKKDLEDGIIGRKMRWDYEISRRVEINEEQMVEISVKASDLFMGSGEVEKVIKEALTQIQIKEFEKKEKIFGEKKA